ncbi:MAG: SDR family NAD(P)-dependent oxidoreductase [Myxococcota bacterium]
MTATLAGLTDLRRRPDPHARVALPDEDRLDGRTALVTGASSGLGKAVAVGLARRGARVVMACRSGVPEAADEVRRLSGSDAVDILRVDLADLASVHALCDTLADRGEPIDVLVLNAGIVPRRASTTAQGLELMFGVNYLAHAVLTRRLLDDGVIPVRQPAPEPDFGQPLSRIVVVSSEVHRSAGPLDPERLEGLTDYGAMGTMKQYGHTKLLLSTFACELARRLAPDGRPTAAVHHLCPGAVHTRIARDAPRWVQPVLGLVMRRLFRSPEVAAGPVLYLCAAREIEGQTGVYLHMETRKPTGERARDPEAGARLWQATDALLRRVDSGRQPPL